jgi:hypothetical protein
MEEILFVPFNPESAFSPQILHSILIQNQGLIVGFTVGVSSPGLVLLEEECPIHYCCYDYNKSVQRSSHCREIQ